SINVLANDTDPEGDALTVTAVGTPDVGEVAIINNEIVYTPTTLAMGEVSFSYDVTDGENTVSSTVTITNQQSVSISSIATDAPLANAEVTALDVGGNVIATTQAGADGRFTLPITVSAAPGDLTLNAVGTEEQAHVTLTSHVGTFTALRSLSVENNTNELTDTLLPESKITHLSTAMDILYSEYKENGGEGSFDTFSSEVDFEKVLGLASFIKVLADNSEFSVPEGMSTLTFFTGSLVDVLSTIREYVNSLGLLNEDGTYDEAYVEAINAARAETLADETLQQNYVDADIADAVFATYYHSEQQAGKGMTAYTFNADGSGEKTSAENAFNIYSDEFKWSVVDGNLVIDQLDQSLSANFVFLDEEIYSRFDEQTVYEISDYAYEYDIRYWETERTVTNERMDLLTQAGGHALAVLTTTTELSLTPMDDIQDKPTFTTTYETTSNVKYSNTTASTFTVTEEDLLASPWVFAYQGSYTFDKEYLNEDERTEVGILNDQFTFKDDNTFMSLVYDAQGTWQLNEGVIEIELEGMSFSVTPFKAQNDFVLALYEFDNDGVAIKFTGDMHAIDYELAEDFSIESSLPNIWMFSYNEALFVDGTPLFDDVFGYYFEPDGTAGRVYPAFEEPYFVGDGELYNFQWTMDNNEVNIVGLRENSAFVFNREYTWKLLGSKQEGVVVTLEMQSNKVDYTDDFNENLVFNILPRLSFTFKLNLEEQYPEFWENTDVGSLSAPASLSDIALSFSSELITR
ncbi:cadherin-like domain-containing protein, partial [Alteromonas sp. ALT199]